MFIEVGPRGIADPSCSVYGHTIVPVSKTVMELTQSSSSDDYSEEENILGPEYAENEASDLMKGRPYPEHVNQVLESLYTNGMTGWGTKHSANLELAVKSTGLELQQVKVSITLVLVVATLPL